MEREQKTMWKLKKHGNGVGEGRGAAMVGQSLHELTSYTCTVVME